ncbi:hypothetical protein AAJP47_08380 [Psychrobacter sp. B38]|uniref:hypothetical protein n=1 Tax=Psychrobacter sp. B38 TaxID=3143538 RepID=UPI00320EA19C
MFKCSVTLGIIFLFLAACTANLQEQKKGIIVINNNSAYRLSDVKIIYESANSMDMLGGLSAHTTYEYEIQYSDFEDSITIYYTDHVQRPRSINAVPYAGKYDKQHYVVNLN